MQFAITNHSNENDWRLFCFVFCENYYAIKMDSFTLCYGFRRILYKMEQFFDVKSLKKSSQYLYSIWQKLVYCHFWKDGGISLVEEGKLWVVLPFPSYFIWNDNLLILFLLCLPNSKSPLHPIKQIYCYEALLENIFLFLKHLAPFHILDFTLICRLLIASL